MASGKDYVFMSSSRAFILAKGGPIPIWKLFMGTHKLITAKRADADSIKKKLNKETSLTWDIVGQDNFMKDFGLVDNGGNVWSLDETMTKPNQTDVIKNYPPSAVEVYILGVKEPASPAVPEVEVKLELQAEPAKKVEPKPEPKMVSIPMLKPEESKTVSMGVPKKYSFFSTQTPPETLRRQISFMSDDEIAHAAEKVFASESKHLVDLIQDQSQEKKEEDISEPCIKDSEEGSRYLQQPCIRASLEMIQLLLTYLMQLEEIRDTVPEQLLNIHRQMEDELHYIELNGMLSEEEGYSCYQRIFELRKARREGKDSIAMLLAMEPVLKSIDIENLIAARNYIYQKAGRVYRLRAPEQFFVR